MNRPGLKSPGRTHAVVVALVTSVLVAVAAPSVGRADEPSPSSSPPLEPSPSPPDARTHRTAFVVFGLAAASAIVGTVYGISALREKRDFDRGDKTTTRVEAIEKRSLLADMAFGAALTFGITGFVLWSAANGDTELASGTRARSRARALTLAPWFSPFPGASASVRF